MGFLKCYLLTLNAQVLVGVNQPHPMLPFLGRKRMTTQDLNKVALGACID